MKHITKHPVTMYLKEVQWIEQRPTKEEFENNLCGVRADQSGVRMEVRVLNTMEHGLHVAVTVCDKNQCLMIKEYIPVTEAVTSAVALCERAFKEGKWRAVMHADAWLFMLTS